MKIIKKNTLYISLGRFILQFLINPFHLYKMDNKFYDLEYTKLPIYKFDSYNINKLKIYLSISGVLIPCNIKDSPHYYLIDGLVNNDNKKVEIYKQYFFSTSPSFDFLQKKERVIELIRDYKKGAEFIPLIELSINSFRFKQYRILDGAHRTSIMFFFKQENIKCATYLYGLKK